MNQTSGLKMESGKSMLPRKGISKGVYTDPSIFRRDLLGWYDRHRRVLPWRAGRGERADPYHVWLSEIMLQQTVVAAVIPYFQKFVDKWPTVHELAAAPVEEVMQAWAGLGYYARARNLHKCAKIVATELGGVFPDDQGDLRTLPGIGDYTSAAITAIAFDKPAVVIDGNVDRVIARYFGVMAALPAGKKDIRTYAASLAEGRSDRPGDFAQAMMDLGATICIPKAPRCALCPLQNSCVAYSKGLQNDLPYKLKKQAKPKKFGYVYWIKNQNGQILLETRPERGMLGGMPALPTSAWEGDKSHLRHDALFEGLEFRSHSDLKIYHGFTHFDLELVGQVIQIEKEMRIKENWLWKDERLLNNYGFPTIFKKFVTLMLHHSEDMLK